MQDDCRVPYRSFRRVVSNGIEGSRLGLAAWTFGGLEIGGEGRWLHSANATVVGLLICKYDVLITVESHDSVREDENEEGDFL